MEVKKIGLALGGGSAKGLAHIGVIKVLEKAGLKISYIAGTSMGALVGGLYAATKDINYIEKLFLEIAEKYAISRFHLPKKENILFKNQEKVEELLSEKVKGKKIEDLEIPFKAVATDVKNGEEIILEKGDLYLAIKASTALPVIFDPVEIDGKLLMDGGFVNPVPLDVVKNMGSEFVIGVDVLNNWPNIGEEKLSLKNIKTITAETITALEYEISKEKLKLADVLMKPLVLSYHWNDFCSAKEIIKKGENEAEKYVYTIRKATHYPKPKKKPFIAFIDFITSNDY